MGTLRVGVNSFWGCVTLQRLPHVALCHASFVCSGAQGAVGLIILG